MMGDVSTWAVLGASASGILAACTVLAFWMRFENRITMAEATAKQALKTALEAMVKVEATNAAFGLYREQVAREYIHREVMREVEERLTQAIERLGDRLDRVLEHRRS
jgi:hypothetical protein